MASILRTGKVLRHFAGLTKNIVYAVNGNETNVLLKAAPYMCSQYQSNFVKAVGTASKQTDWNLERQLQQLDKDVRRIGRISRRDIEEILDEIRTQRFATSSQSLMIIRCCGNLVPEELPENRTKLVQEIWETLNSINVPMDISHFNALLRVYLENEYTFSPTEFLSELEARSIEPNRVTYQRLIARYCQEGDIEGATKILEYMRSKNLPVNEAVFNSLILGHSQANDLKSAKDILNVMKQAGLEPSSETYATLMCCYAKHGDIDSLMELLNECERQDILLIDKDLLDIIYNITVNGNGDKVDFLINKCHRSMGFNQECVNLILRLTNLGYEDVCLKLLRIMPRGNRPDGQLTDCGSFFIRQMVKAKRPLDKILNVCQILQQEGLNDKGLLLATEASLIHGYTDISLELFKQLKLHNLPVREHYFWPLFCTAGQKEIADIIHIMQNEFEITLSSETLRDYVIPNLEVKDWDKILAFLRDTGIPSGTAAASTSYAALVRNQIEIAAQIMESYRSIYNFQIFRLALIPSLEKTKNYEAFVRCLRQVYESSQRRFEQLESEQQQKEEEENQVETPDEESNALAKSNIPDIIGDTIWDICSYYRVDNVQILEELLPLFIEEGFSIKNESAVRISEKLGSRMTSNISELLGRLSSDELKLKPLKNNKKKKSLDDLTLEELERFMVNVEAKGEDSTNIKRYLLSALIRSKNLEKVLQIINDMENKNNFTLSTGLQAQIIDLYVYHNQLEDALNAYNAIKEKDPTFQLNPMKTVAVVELLLKENRQEEAMKFLEENKRQESIPEVDINYNYTNKVWHLLTVLADNGEEEKLQKIFDKLVDLKYIVPTNVLLGPLIKVHLVKDDVNKAVQTFEKLCELYKVTPWKNELMRRLIEAEDAVNLQRITDLSTNIHGEINSLYDLVFSFVECGRVRQARRILETPGLLIRSHRINNACERYKNENRVEPLEGLIEATKDLNHIDRGSIYYSLLLTYCNMKDVDKALGLWTKMQEESVTPSDAFLITLAEFLKQENRSVPFVVPNKKMENSEDVTEIKQQSHENTNSNELKSQNQPQGGISQHIQFRRALRNGDIDTALLLKDQLGASNVGDTSLLIEGLVKCNRLREATKYVNELLSNNLMPKNQIFRFYLNHLANAGDIQTMAFLDEQLNDEQKRIVSFDNRFCHTYIVAGKAKEYLNKLLNDAEKIQSTEKAAELAQKFPRGGAIGILEKHPELLEEYKKLSEIYAKYEQLGPINVLWMHYLSIGDEKNSKIIWDKYLSNAPRLMFQRVLQTARETNNDHLVQQMLNQVRESKISEAAIGNVYSCLINILLTQKQHDKALDVVRAAIKDISLENINMKLLHSLKDALKEENKQFPFDISEKKSGDFGSSSSSQSDDDISPETRTSKPQNKEVQSHTG